MMDLNWFTVEMHIVLVFHDDVLAIPNANNGSHKLLRGRVAIVKGRYFYCLHPHKKKGEMR